MTTLDRPRCSRSTHLDERYALAAAIILIGDRPQPQSGLWMQLTPATCLTGSEEQATREHCFLKNSGSESLDFTYTPLYSRLEPYFSRNALHSAKITERRCSQRRLRKCLAASLDWCFWQICFHSSMVALTRQYAA